MMCCAVLCCGATQVESKSIPDIARELAHLQQLAAAGKLSSLDVTGGSITISNIGEPCSALRVWSVVPVCFQDQAQ